MSRFPPPALTTLKISNGDTLTVKRRLNAGESRAAFARMARTLADGSIEIDPLLRGITIITAYLVDWSLTDDTGQLVVIRDQPPPVVIAALDALDSESYLEIQNAIEAHDAELLRERNAEKNAPDGGNASSPISPLPDAAIGASSGSANSTPTSTT
jgi:hypothetical protein